MCNPFRKIINIQLHALVPDMFILQALQDHHAGVAGASTSTSNSLWDQQHDRGFFTIHSPTKL